LADGQERAAAGALCLPLSERLLAERRDREQALDQQCWAMRCGEEVPMAAAARAETQAVPISTGNSRRLFGEGGSRRSRMGKADRRPERRVATPSKAVGLRGSLVQVNRSHDERK